MGCPAVESSQFCAGHPEPVGSTRGLVGLSRVNPGQPGLSRSFRIAGSSRAGRVIPSQPGFFQCSLNPAHRRGRQSVGTNRQPHCHGLWAPSRAHLARRATPASGTPGPPSSFVCHRSALARAAPAGWAAHRATTNTGETLRSRFGLARVRRVLAGRSRLSSRRAASAGHIITSKIG